MAKTTICRQILFVISRQIEPFETNLFFLQKNYTNICTLHLEQKIS